MHCNKYTSTPIFTAGQGSWPSVVAIAGCQQALPKLQHQPLVSASCQTCVGRQARSQSVHEQNSHTTTRPLPSVSFAGHVGPMATFHYLDVKMPRERQNQVQIKKRQTIFSRKTMENVIPFGILGTRFGVKRVAVGVIFLPLHHIR